MASKEGKQFEENIESSCNRHKPPIFFDRIKDVMIPPDLRDRVKVPHNKHDCYIFNGFLFALELKSTQEARLSFSESIIKKHQIESLCEANTFDKVISGFLVNFREPVNKVYFIHIVDFIEYRKVADGLKANNYKAKVNEKSMHISMCEEIGLEVTFKMLRVNAHYHIKQFTEAAIQKYGSLRT